MLSRRTFLAGAAAPAAAPLVSADVGRAEAAATLPLDLVNRRAGRAAFAVVTGLDPVSRRWFFMAADGRTRIYAGDPARAVALSEDIAIPLPHPLHRSARGSRTLRAGYDDVHTSGFNTEGRVLDAHPRRLVAAVG